MTGTVLKRLRETVEAVKREGGKPIYASVSPAVWEELILIRDVFGTNAPNDARDLLTIYMDGVGVRRHSNWEPGMPEIHVHGEVVAQPVSAVLDMARVAEEWTRCADASTEHARMLRRTDAPAEVVSEAEATADTMQYDARVARADAAKAARRGEMPTEPSDLAVPVPGPGVAEWSRMYACPCPRCAEHEEVLLLDSAVICDLQLRERAALDERDAARARAAKLADALSLAEREVVWWRERAEAAEAKLVLLKRRP